jgi:rhamnosyltransferase
MIGASAQLQPPETDRHLKPSGQTSQDIVAPTAENTCALIVTYHPDIHLAARIEKILPQVHRIVVVDNGSSPSCVQPLRDLADQSGVHLISNPRNEGLARALNEGTQWAADNAYQWVLQLDQDTTVEPDMLDSLAQVFRQDRAPQSIAIIGANYIDKVTGKPGAALSPFIATDEVAVLTSGSLLSLNAFRALGGFRDDFFIDCVDFEYCLRARAHGFRVVMTSRPVMTHGVGHLTQHRFLGTSVSAANHSPERRYFISRNSLIIARQYLLQEPRWILKYLSSLLKLVVIICLFEKARFAKLRYIFRGCVDGLLGRMGGLPS